MAKANFICRRNHVGGSADLFVNCLARAAAAALLRRGDGAVEAPRIAA